MKRKILIRYLEKNGCELYREGSKHSVYLNRLNGKTTTILRHIEIFDILASKICRDLDINDIKKK